MGNAAAESCHHRSSPITIPDGIKLKRCKMLSKLVRPSRERSPLTNSHCKQFNSEKHHVSTVMSVTKFSIRALENAADCEIRPSHIVSRVTLVELNKAT